MVVEMEIHEFARFALDQGLPEIRKKVKKPRIHSILSEVEADASGNTALWLWVVLDDPPTSEMSEENLNRIRKAVIEALQGTQFRLVMPVYFFFQTKAERTSAGFPT